MQFIKTAIFAIAAFAAAASASPLEARREMCEYVENYTVRSFPPDSTLVA
jgi:hypothetical protein